MKNTKLNMKTIEEWRDIPNFEGLYQVSNLVYLGYFIDEDKASEMYLKALEHKDLYTGDNKKFRTMLNNLT